MTDLILPLKTDRTFLPRNLVIDSWNTIKSYYEDLKNRPIGSIEQLNQWLHDLSELDSIIQEDLGWRYIRSSCDTTDEKTKQDFQFFISEIKPHLSPYEDELHKKILSCPFIKDLKLEGYKIYFRQIKKAVEIFREENIPLFTELETEEQKYAEIAGAMTIEMEGKELTLQQAANYLKDTDRNIRKEAYHKIVNRRLIDRKVLDALYSKLILIRHKVAINAGFDNFRNYMFAALGRFDYTPSDCFKFHEAIAYEVVPLNNDMEKERKNALHLNSLKPWDTEVDLSGKPALKPFTDGEDLMQKTIQCFDNINPLLGECMRIMKTMKRIDLDSRKGKAPGGYNYPLHETGVPFIFMNSANSLRDLITMVHEGGHAVHSIVTHDLGFMGFKDTPSEVAELASMSMELITMEHWDTFFSDPEELKRAKKQQLEKVLDGLPWIATIDKFQHWIYTHPEHTAEERTEIWKQINTEFSGNIIDWSGDEAAFETLWQKQLHLYQVPFYYIEYGMAQLGAIAVWRNYKRNPEKALNDYLNALKLGYTQTIGEIYSTAGIKFDFSREYVRELAGFVIDEIRKI